MEVVDNTKQVNSDHDPTVKNEPETDRKKSNYYCMYRAIMALDKNLFESDIIGL